MNYFFASCTSCRVLKALNASIPGIATIALASSLMLAGCGSSNRTIAVPSVSPFAGTYEGDYSYVGAPTASGPISVTVDADGKATGTAFDGEVNETAAVSGAVSRNGSLIGTFVFPDSTFTATGTVAFAANGHLTGTLQEYYGTDPVGAFVVDLTRK